MCTFKTSPFVPAQRTHMFQHVCAWCRYTRGRFERTHGDVFSGHTGFSACHTHTPRPQRQTQHNTTTRPQHHTETETETDRDRERRKGQREEKTEEERQDKRRFILQCGSDFLVSPVCARDLSLLNSVKYDSSLISFSAPWQVNSFFISANLLLYAVAVFIFYDFFLIMQLQFRVFPNYFYAATVFFAGINSA